MTRKGPHDKSWLTPLLFLPFPFLFSWYCIFLRQHSRELSDRFTSAHHASAKYFDLFGLEPAKASLPRFLSSAAFLLLRKWRFSHSLCSTCSVLSTFFFLSLIFFFFLSSLGRACRHSTSFVTLGLPSTPCYQEGESSVNERVERKEVGNFLCWFRANGQLCSSTLA
jgi:hypothetical protein